jgi:hypothetical protein
MQAVISVTCIGPFVGALVLIGLRVGISGVIGTVDGPVEGAGCVGCNEGGASGTGPAGEADVGERVPDGAILQLKQNGPKGYVAGFGSAVSGQAV